MKVIICALMLIIPAWVSSQNTAGVPYEEAWDACQKMMKEKQLMYPDSFFYTGPECLIGAAIPELSATTFDGHEISREYFKGKLTVVNFWTISCPPCIAEMPGFDLVVDKFGHDKVNYLAIGADEKDEIIDFLKKHPWKFSQLASGWKVTFEIFQMRWGYPTTMVINEDGIIVAAFSGGKTDESAVKEIEEKLSAIIQEVLR